MSTKPDSPYPPPAPLPTQLGPEGIRFDFNLGARVLLPRRTDGGRWRVRLRDLDTGNILYESQNQGAFVNSAKRWFVRFRVEVWDVAAGDETNEETSGHAGAPVLAHEYAARGREVLIHFPIGTLGDVLAWFPYAARFAERHGCRLTCAMSGLIIPLLGLADK
jgi:autotransporter strand-loop-strand O-heptosyltransferase